jgi:hypothetical protein
MKTSTTTSRTAAALAQARPRVGLREQVIEPADGDANELLDALILRCDLKCDAGLSRILRVSAPVISKIRHGKVGVSPALLIRMHDTFELSINELRAMMRPPAEARAD